MGAPTDTDRRSTMPHRGFWIIYGAPLPERASERPARRAKKLDLDAGEEALILSI